MQVKQPVATQLISCESIGTVVKQFERFSPRFLRNCGPGPENLGKWGLLRTRSQGLP